MDVYLIPPNVPANVDLSYPRHLRSAAAAFGLLRYCQRSTNLFGRKLCFQFFSLHTSQLSLTKSFKNMTWSIRSNADGSGGLDSSSMNGTDTGTRLIRMIRGIQSQLGKKIQELRKNLPVKLLCFLVGFYCATAFATVIGQTGDWDILSAALAVVVVEGIGALIYKASLPLISNIRNLIIMLNYWKAGLSMGLFLDSFKYEMDNFLDPCSLFNFDMDLLPRFL
ncbi:hypothetical protein SAY87_000432 [Trapa incisa]|uniref:Ycf20-like protein n=1 Tax=Trapa incisa TaxID=236973 RepID=A0AAN7J9T7_9MYRT|nr:hypothetical protein SAY87_000432 [Trapa incisa]